MEVGRQSCKIGKLVLSPLPKAELEIPDLSYPTADKFAQNDIVEPPWQSFHEATESHLLSACS